MFGFFTEPIDKLYWFYNNDHLQVMLLYSYISLITFFADGLVKFTQTSHNFDLRSALYVAANKALNPSILIFLYVILVLNILFLDLGVVWNNSIYLYMNGPAAYNLPHNFAVMLKALLSLIGLLSTFYFAISIKLKRPDHALLSSIPFIFCFIYQLASHSRITTTYIFAIVLVFVLFTQDKIKKRLYAICGVFLIIFTLLFSLQGRGSGQHGISNIPAGIAAVATSSTTEDLSFAFTNVMQGIFVTAEGLDVPAEHTTKYKVLSFSPFPSIIDGFASIREKDEIRVNYFIPMSTFAELYHFGFIYIIIFSVLYGYTVVRLSDLQVNKSSIVAILCNIYFFILFVIMNSYSVRNVFRQMLILIVILALLKFFTRYKKVIIGSFSVSFR
jgi:hypothetical protein